MHLLRDIFSRLPIHPRFEDYQSRPAPPPRPRSTPVGPRLVDTKHHAPTYHIIPSADVDYVLRPTPGFNGFPSNHTSHHHKDSHSHSSRSHHSSSRSRADSYSERHTHDNNANDTSLHRGHSHHHSLSSSFIPPHHNEEPEPSTNGFSSNSRVSSSGSLHATAGQTRPALKRSHTSESSHGTRSSSDLEKRRRHVSFVNPYRPQTLHMHPLLASNHLTHAPISYDVLLPPSVHSVVDRTTRNSVPGHVLSQPATDPPTFDRLVLKSDMFSWPVVAFPGGRSTSFESQSQSHHGHGSGTTNKFFLGDIGSHNSHSHSHSSHSNQSDTPITNFDVLNAVYKTLHIKLTQDEWETLGRVDTRGQRRAARAYERRCRMLGGGWDEGVQRVDLLGERSRLNGVMVDKSETEVGIAKLVFSKP
ncbi:hypothetical protein D9758_013619 [Tetrapyrgos nigripes]|uniref:DUF6699 domain-containing protein n=1 Tax=Tetrapyrgos nigripes TaxID=182062 RepID=A0A8H5FQ34_9AGAR|nr:hypothetical protein D9758_013619 [Tetrapyrgos nigripes]